MRRGDRGGGEAAGGLIPTQPQPFSSQPVKSIYAMEGVVCKRALLVCRVQAEEISPSLMQNQSFVMVTMAVPMRTQVSGCSSVGSDTCRM